MKTYELKILPLFENDLNEIIEYIAGTLGNPIAASSMVSEVEKAIYDRLQSAEVFEQYELNSKHELPYYKIHVKNYTIFYVVIGNVMEVRRIIYSRRNIHIRDWR